MNSSSHSDSFDDLFKQLKHTLSPEKLKKAREDWNKFKQGGKQHANIFILGKTGVGKSSLIMFLVKRSLKSGKESLLHRKFKNTVHQN
ncbi:MAG: hypothetical protein J6U18_06005, partial [Acetobacter sp.]|nr:hypothetical protein [Acetobacter sp.]